VDRVVAEKAEAYCPRLEGLAPWFLRRRNCLDTYELLNSLLSKKINKKIARRDSARDLALAWHLPLLSQY
jgi:hypothetical protein